MTIPLFERQVTVFHGRKDVEPVEQLPLGTMLERTRDGTYQPWVETLRAYRIEFGEKGYKDEKAKSHAFTPCCALTTRAQDVPWASKLISTSGVVQFDIDDVDDPEAVKAQLAQDPRVCFTFLSPSARGVKVGVAADGITGPDDYKTVWAAILKEFQHIYAAWTFKTDVHVKFLNALCYVSYDPDLYVNPTATPFVMPTPAPTKPRKARSMPPPGTGESDEARAQEALRHIPADDYEIWLAVGMALHSTAWPMARSLWDTWSATSDKYEEKTQDSKWRGFVEEGGRTIATMFDLAKKHGWQPPKKVTWTPPKLPVAIPQMWSEAAPHAAPVDTAAPAASPGTPGAAPPAATLAQPPIDPNGFLTDNFNARALVKDHRQDLRYCYLWKSWLVRTKTHWQRDTSGAAMQFAKQSIKGLARQAEGLDLHQARALYGHIKSSLSTNRLKAMLMQAQDEPGIPVQPAQLDRDPWLLNCQNGTLDLRTGKVRDHQKEDLLTRCLDVDYNEDAECSTWKAFLWHIMNQDQALIDFLQRAIGYALTGVIREHVLIILWGNGRNGKSTFLGTLLSLLGPYAMKAPSELLMVGAHDRHPTERADLFQKRFVAAIETEQGRRLAEVFVKEATGGDRITARRMREDFWSFDPTHKVFLATNHKPIIRGKENAIWERLKLVEFGVTITKPDTTLAEKLQEEGEGILAWAVRGCMAWQKNGLGEPDAVTQAVGEWRTASDALGAFIAARCLIGPNYRIKASDLYEAYTLWCEQNKKEVMGQRRWGMDLTERGNESFRVDGRAWWKHITLKPVDEASSTAVDDR